MKKRLFGVVLLGSVLGLSAQKQQIEEILIKGKFWDTPYQKITENIAVLTKEELQNTPAQSIEEALQQITGIDIRKRGANGVQSDISIRGGSFDQVLILINGIRMNDSQTGHNSMNLPVDLDNVERIEVIKGPAARRFGNNAYAGVINIITRIQQGNSVKILAEGGDFNTYSLGLSAHFGGEKFSQSLSLNNSQSAGYRHNTDYAIRNAFYQNQIKIKNGSVQLQAGFSEKKFGANGFYASPKFTEQYEEVQASIVSLGYQQKFENFGINANAYWRRGQDMYLFNRNKPEIYRNMHIGNNIGGEINANYQSSLGRTGLGVELRKEFLVSNNLGKRDRFLTQVFFEHRFSLLGDKLLITPGISWANYNTAGNFFYPGIDAGFNIDEQNKIYANISKVHRVPTYTELYYNDRTTLGNANLKAESAISSEVGYQFKNQYITVKASGFMRNAQNSIDFVKVDINDKWSAQNIGDLNLKGVELELNHRPTNWLNYTAGYTFIDNKRSLSGQMFSKYALENLKHQFVGKIETKFLKYFTNELIYRYNQRLDLENYHILDGKLSFKKDGYNLYVLVNNITNTQFSDMGALTPVPMPGRWFHIGMNYNIKFK
ncbi:MAG: TonB-dependent receptor [Flavobacteriaceae bacterium]|nr:TonB-dependent receptor [Flavobacteriaceae bacterium]